MAKLCILCHYDKKHEFMYLQTNIIYVNYISSFDIKEILLKIYRSLLRFQFASHIFFDPSDA